MVNPTYDPNRLQQLAQASQFFASLLEDHTRYGALTRNQIATIDKSEGGSKIDVSGIELAFKTAKGNGVQRPKLRLAGFSFSEAPENGKNPGALYVTNHQERYLGKVLQGKFLPVRDCDRATELDVVKAASDPYQAAVDYGNRFGSCSVCNRPLSNPESVKMGIGPICRQKFGW